MSRAQASSLVFYARERALVLGSLLEVPIPRDTKICSFLSDCREEAARRKTLQGLRPYFADSHKEIRVSWPNTPFV